MTSRIEAKLLKDVTYEQFKKFLNSLDVEKNSWSLDLQVTGLKSFKNDKEFYDECSKKAIENYNKHYNEKVFLKHMEEIFNETN